ncbi:MAG TPA: DUF3109 family protein [Bacteroidota bacterium]|jgi:hypothetical protein|nr:DUF3109 family protein [Bacteroidota bacterium]
MKPVVLKHHKVGHIGDLRVNENIFTTRFNSACSMMNCNAQCCKYGVWLDVNHRTKILAHAEMIQKHMDEGMERNPEKWFVGDDVDDADFASGRATSTAEGPRGCTFLLKDGKCVLQAAAVAEGMDRFALKPFYCWTYPITIEAGELMMDELEFGFRSECCSPVEGGSLSIFDLCTMELEFILGPQGLKELIAARDSRGND